MATGDKVVERTALVKELLSKCPKLIGLEMEAGGVTWIARDVSQQAFMVRAVSDLANEDKVQEAIEAWRAYACDVRLPVLSRFFTVAQFTLDKVTEKNSVYTHSGPWRARDFIFLVFQKPFPDLRWTTSRLSLHLGTTLF